MAETQTGTTGTTDGAGTGTGTAAGTTPTGSTGSSSDAGKTGTAGEAGTGGSSGDAGKEPRRTAEAATSAPKAPEKYTLSVPESGKAYSSDALLRQVEAVARANSWSNEDAQAALEEHLDLVRQQAEAFATETKTDPDYGGDRFDETQRLARKAIDRVRPAGHARRDAFLTFLGRGGAGNHIEVVSFLADLGKLMSDDTPLHGRGTASSGADAASKLYDHETSRRLDQETAR